MKSVFKLQNWKSGGEWLQKASLRQNFAFRGGLTTCQVLYLVPIDFVPIFKALGGVLRIVAVNAPARVFDKVLFKN